MSVLIVTSLGDIVVDLYADKCPLTCKNFLKLCKIKYYNGCLFHTVQKDFTAQTGDPTGTGTGGDSVYKLLYGDQARFFSDEIHLDLKHSKMGTVAMASAGENLNASQFYVTLRSDLDYLDGKHTVFGEVAEGIETLTRINDAYVDEKNRPYKNIRIKHTYVLDDPFDDPHQLAELIPEASPEGKPNDEVDVDVRLEDDWVPLDEQLGPAELEEMVRVKEAHSSAVVLESIGDIPEAEVKPPDDVLFVCKLNPVTEDEDLHTIFSRFGTVLSAEIIRDYKTGDSLCYAFIEFETRDACEAAYFKMDNALIDDRRIHVDFSQSVSKLWFQYRRKDNQMGKGRGCFKCGALDHMAKDCTGIPAAKLQPANYILKHDNRQHGGDQNSRYDMVFDGETPEVHEKRHGHHIPDDRISEQKMHRSSQDVRYRVDERKGSSDRHRQSDRTRGPGEDDMHREGKASLSRGSRRDQDYYEGKMDKEKHSERRTDRDDCRSKRSSDSVHRDDRAERREDEYYRKRTVDNDSHIKRRDEVESRKSMEVDHRKRRAVDGDRDYRRKNVDEDRHDAREKEPLRRKNSADYDGHKRREEHEHRHKGRNENDDDRRELDSGKRQRDDRRR
ncbi:hypothetical protein HS088_TW03G00901 [Tripterygium wilfordii]|uniref:Peptidyl-prolyl cis-trans isomerase n=1 Tax=Tripterygium wilfordii TaxID=458696 RepID=A0A7J7DW17_TRIWF|nr:peptidyl-prolyl cis-trans isomerase CYP59 [Tripterygium wilfordii]KAF5750562.1 hypothetical protein HS088_TW03G00901 [Tripterygium wilfordii]